VYNHLAAEKQMEIYRYHKHEVPYEHQELRLRVLHEALKP
jgi:cephalosporin-C deacetylase-like acetyl esterase